MPFKVTINNKQTGESRSVTFQNKPTDQDIASAEQQVFKPKEQASPLQAAIGGLKATAKTAIDPRRLQTPEALGVGQGAIQAGTFGFGVPLLRKAVGKEASEQVRPPTTKESLVGMGLAAPLIGAGAAKAAPGKVSQLVRAFKSPGIVKGIKALPVAKSIATGAATAFAFNPSDVELVPLADKRRFTNAAIGAVTAGMAAVASKASKTISNAMIANSDAKAEVFGKTVVRQAVRAKNRLSKKFGKELQLLSDANPGKTVDVADDFAQLSAASGFNQKVGSILERSKNLKRLAQNPELAKNMPLIELQNLKNDIQSKLPKSVLDGRNVTADDFPITDFLEGIADKQLATFPGMAPIRAAYRKGINDWKIVRNQLQDKTVLSTIEGGVTKGFKGAIERQALSRLLQKVAPDLVPRINEIGKNVGMQRVAVNLTKRFLELGALTAALRMSMGDR